MNYYYKLTDQKIQTYDGCQWEIGEEKTTSGKGDLCTKGWLHCYDSPLLAVLLNPIGANFTNPRLFEVKVGGKKKADYGLKFGFTKMTLVKEIPLPEINIIQKIAFGILCAKDVNKDEKWNIWADNWLSGNNRTRAAAWAAAAWVARAAAAAAAAWVARTADEAAWAAAAEEEVARAAWYAAWGKEMNLKKIAEKAMTY